MQKKNLESFAKRDKSAAEGAVTLLALPSTPNLHYFKENCHGAPG